MTKESFKKPKWVWINSPSTTQPYNKFHGRVGIAVLICTNEKTDYWELQIFLVDGNRESLQIDPLYLSEYSQPDRFWTYKHDFDDNGQPITRKVYYGPKKENFIPLGLF